MVEFKNKLGAGTLVMFGGRISSTAGATFSMTPEQAGSDETATTIKRGWIERITPASETEVTAAPTAEPFTLEDIEPEVEKPKTRVKK